MSRAAVRTGLTDWLTNPLPDGIATVYTAQPSIIPGTAFFTGAGASDGCVAWIQVGRAVEVRVAMGGATGGWKRVDYPVIVQLRYRRIAPATYNSDKQLEAAAAFDTIIDNLKTQIRADRTAAGAVWQWGEADLGDNVGEPVLDGQGSVLIWGQVTTTATEWLAT